MRISIELEQNWDTLDGVLTYLRLLVQILEQVEGLGVGAPQEWYVSIDRGGEEYILSLTHL